MLVFACHAEQMAFVVDDRRAVRWHPDHAVEGPVPIGDDQAAGDRGAERSRAFPHPGYRLALHRLGDLP